MELGGLMFPIGMFSRKSPSIAQALVKHNTDPELMIDVMALKGHESQFLSVEKKYDRVLVMGWQMAESRSMRMALDGDRWLTGMHSHHSFDPDLLTRPDHDIQPPWPLILFLRKLMGQLGGGGGVWTPPERYQIVGPIAGSLLFTPDATHSIGAAGATRPLTVYTFVVYLTSYIEGGEIGDPPAPPGPEARHNAGIRASPGGARA